MRSNLSILFEDLMMVMVAVIVFILWLGSDQGFSFMYLLHM